MQKTLANFIVLGDSSRKTLGDQISLGSDINDQHIMQDIEGSFSFDSLERQQYGIGDPLDGNNVQDLDACHYSSTDIVEFDNIHVLSSNRITDKVWVIVSSSFIFQMFFSSVL